MLEQHVTEEQHVRVVNVSTCLSKAMKKLLEVSNIFTMKATRRACRHMERGTCRGAGPRVARLPVTARRTFTCVHVQALCDAVNQRRRVH